MRIVENTPERLVLEHRRVVRPVIMTGVAALFLVTGVLAHSDAPGITYGFILIAAMLLFGVGVFDLHQCRAVFSRAHGVVTLQSGFLGRGAPRFVRLSSIRKAFADVSGTNSRVTGTMMDGGRKRAALALHKGPSVPLLAIYRSGSSADETVKAVNDWLGREGAG